MEALLALHQQVRGMGPSQAHSPSHACVYACTTPSTRPRTRVQTQWLKGQAARQPTLYC